MKLLLDKGLTNTEKSDMLKVIAERYDWNKIVLLESGMPLSF
jgi:hypothetical protein